MFKVILVDREYCGDHYKSCILEYTDGNYKFRFDSEEPERILELDVDADHGIFDGKPRNGNFFLSWSKDKIEIVSAKYDECGSLGVSIEDPSNEHLTSLHNALKEWKQFFTEN